MNRPFWITLALSAIVATTAYVALGLHNKRLSDQLAAGQGAEEQTPSRPSKSDRTPSPPLSSEEKTERASEGVNRFIASLVPPDGSRAEEMAKGAFPSTKGNEEDAGRRIMFWENLPDLLRSVEGLSVDELLAVAADLPVPERASMGGSSEFLYDTRAHLIMLAAEQDPMRVLQDENLMEGIDEFAVLRCLAIVDPAAAVRLLPEIVLPGDVYAKDKRERLGATMLGSDVDLGLTLLLETRESDPDREEGMHALNGANIGEIPLPPEVIPKLVEAIDKPEFGAIRNDLIKTTLDHHLTENGVAAAARQAKAIGLTPEEIGLYLDSVSKTLIPTSPEAMVNWMADALSADQQSQKIPETIVEWANRDVEAASTWLGKQPPSAVRDQAIARFATQASELDPEAAAAWAREIEDEQLREQTLREVSNR